MHVCPRGHESQSADYCDECGAPIGGASAAVPLGAAAPSGEAIASPSVGTQNAAPRAKTSGSAATLCPECNTPATGRFCESCGFDLLMAALAPAVEAAGAATPSGVAAGSATPDGVAASAATPDGVAASAATPDGVAAGAATPDGVAAGAVTSSAPDMARPPESVEAPDTAAPAETAAPDNAVAAPVEPDATASSGQMATPAEHGDAGGGASTSGVTWRVVVSADAAYHQRMQAEPDAEPIAFPTYCPERRFVLDGQQVLIGRRSRSRGIEPQIDLSGPPEDPAVSHAHALFVGQPGDKWAVVDLDSANGTYVNDATDPIRANEPVSLADGDRVHVGAWTTLTLVALQ
jgi:FHA domain